jgi:hypothetical protein
MELKINIPDYLSIKDWRYFNSLELESEMDKMVHFIAYISDLETEQIRSYTPIQLKTIYSALLEKLTDIESTFFPLIEINGQLYGYSSISKMSLGEYIDLEKLTKNPAQNIEEIMAILYRPITKHSFNGVIWAYKNKYKTGTGDVENLFKYYTLEKYDNDKRKESSEIFKSIPVSFALGALSFFLALANSSLISTQYSSIPDKKLRTKLVKSLNKAASIPIGDGLLQFITYQKLPSLTLPETKAYQN